ncbi:Telomere maintenance protein [Drechslerella dactyloides]|uniref:Telomere maintenance protein n=1 Tax=Drechslerella dactyloides TaxID=74499 RepID=A0AAD6IX35_DREDA|nr:Telomere maintenance protein [Drechslerella dactyloides]
MPTANFLVETFSGLGLPSTLSLPLPSDAPISDLFNTLDPYIPSVPTPLRLTTTSGKPLSPSSESPLSTLLEECIYDFVTLRLTAPLPGGKGGFGSQLRAAGGRMSSRKRKGQENSDSCRNLDGRRLRTVKEAKALAQYLETKPDMDKKEREKRRERWEKVVEAADEKIRGGGSKANARFDDTKWLEEKDEGRERAREAVIRAMKAGSTSGSGAPSPGKSSTSEDIDEEEEEDNNAGEGTSSKSSEDEAVETEVAKPKPKVQPRKFVGFDEDDEFLSSDDDEEEEVGKGKGKATAA